MISAASLLRSARRRAGLTQRELARRARVPQPTIAAIESGRQDPRYNTLSRLLRAAGYELDYWRPEMDGIDRTLIRESLRRTPTERLRAAVRANRLADAFRRARRIS